MRRLPLIHLPTPMHRLPRISSEIGEEVWIKRDDLTGLALGGNKGRKLEYLLSDALEQGAEVVVTCGAAQSNFVRQLGAACCRCGLSCAAAVMELPFEEVPPVGRRLSASGGNVVLDRLFGVDLRLLPDGEWDLLYDAAELLAQEYESKGRVVYRIPVGGSSPLGAFALHQAGIEVADSGPRFDWIVAASSSGSTQTGLAYAFNETNTQILGICSDPEPELVQDFAELGRQLAPLIGANDVLKPEAFNLNVEYVGPGYGVPSPEGDEAIRRMARAEGILLDPIYTGKAFAGLLDLVNRREIGGRILFWHTGGVPALFADQGW